MVINIKNPPKNVQVISNPTGAVVQNNTTLSPSWISVKERLPVVGKEYAWVLVTADGAINCAMFNGKYFYDPTYAEAYNIDFDKVTHWMEIPEPPEGR